MASKANVSFDLLWEVLSVAIFEKDYFWGKSKIGVTGNLF